MNIFFLSYGKDSMANLLLAIEHGIPIDRVVHCDIRFSSDISGEHPIMAKWIPTADNILKELFGLTVEHIYSGISFVSQFYTVKRRGKHVGEFYGFPCVVGSWCNARLKMSCIFNYLSQFKNTSVTQFLGIAYDEPARFNRLLNKATDKIKFRSLLFEHNIFEKDTFDICKKYNLLSPVYGFDDIYRSGCWFCPKQCLADLYSLWKNYPELYFRLELMESDSFYTFRADSSLSNLSFRFRSGYVPKRRKKSNFSVII